MLIERRMRYYGGIDFVRLLGCANDVGVGRCYSCVYIVEGG